MRDSKENSDIALLLYIYVLHVCLYDDNNLTKSWRVTKCKFELVFFPDKCYVENSQNLAKSFRALHKMWTNVQK